MKNNLLFICIISLLISCSKKEDGDLSGKETIRGRLFLLDIATQNINNKPLAKKKVMIKYSESADTLNFLFSTLTDEDGYYSFSNLKKDKQYTVYYDETINNIRYHAEGSATAPNLTLVITAEIATDKQAGILFTVKDNNGNIVKSAPVCVFASENSPGYVNGNCEGSIVQLKTDSSGHANLFNIDPDEYFFISSFTINNVPFTAKGSVKIGAKVAFVTINLQQPTGIVFTVRDYTGNIVKNAPVCLFTTDTGIGYATYTCDGSTYPLTTDAKGQASLYNIPSKSYYYTCSAVVGKVPMKAKGTVVVGSGVVSANIDLPEPSGIAFTVKDNSGNIVKNAPICLFVSDNSIGYNANSCDGSSYQLTTDNNGQANIYDLAPATYYVVSTASINQVPLSGKGSVEVADKVVKKAIELKSPNGIHFVTTDNNSNAIANVNICVFNSPELFENGNCDGSTFQTNSGSVGMIDKYNLPKGTYYVLATITIGSSSWTGKQTVTVGESIVNCALKLQKD